MSVNSYENIAIALAGIIQAAYLVKTVAQTGKITEDEFAVSLSSLFQTNPADTVSVFGSLSNLKMGLEKLVEQTGGKPDRTITRYVLSIIHLQKKLSRSPKLMQHLTQRLAQINKQVDYFSLTHPTVIANLADLYLGTISQFNFRIIVWGNQRILRSQDAMEKIRALLLTGIRAAVLWRQVGGSRWQLLFTRAKIQQAAKKLLENLNH